MARRPAVTGGGGVFLALLLVGLVALALRPGGETVVMDDSDPVVPPDDGTPVVHTLRAPGGFSLFGLQVVDPTHTVEVVFVAGPGCAALLESGEPWPTPHPECAHSANIQGLVGGTGISSSGMSMVGVSFSVPGDCFDLLTRGVVWPPSFPECAP